MTTSPQSQILRIASRNSPLALWQANYVKSTLESAHAGLDVTIIGFTTQGDRVLDTALSKVGGKGLFVKELEVALLEGEADIAVHSMKDVPMELPEGLVLPVYCPREDPRDALVSQQYTDLDSLPPGARVGTSSLRRQCQLRARYPNLDIRDLRGNVNTRLSKLDSGDYDAIILATAGLLRLDMASRIRQKIPVETSLPAAGQGAVGIECRAEDDQTISLIERLHDHQTALAVKAERAVNRHLQGGCQVPVGCYGEITDEKIFLRALVGSVDGRIILSEELTGEVDSGEELGIRLAERLLDKGADKVLAEFFQSQN
ncbi:MAG: hydroxymethylbilane synthase [Porticoccaceae bacterium]|nr:hydroxymethylbilane synthase [Porticoccaceae bacterium]